MSFEKGIPPIPPIDDPQFPVWLEENLNSIRQDIHLIRQFLLPAVDHCKNTPDEVIDNLL